MMMIIADDDVRGDLHPWATCTLGRLAPMMMMMEVMMMMTIMLTMNDDDE